MTAILLALGSSVGYGVSDFLASRVTKRVAPVLLVLYSQTLQGVVLLVVVLAVSQPFSGAGLAWGTAAGAVGAAGLVAYYQALAVGQTAIIAPLASSGAVLPLLVDLAGGERPSAPALADPGGAGRGRRDLARLGRGGGRGGPGPGPDLARPAGAPAAGRRAPPARAGPARPGRGRVLRAVLRRRRPGRRGRRRERPLGRPRCPGRGPAHHRGRGDGGPGPPPRHRRPGPAVAGGLADRAQPVGRRLPGLRRDPRRPGRGGRHGLARPGGHGRVRPRPDRRATGRRPDRRGRPGRPRHPGRLGRPGGVLAIQSDPSTRRGGPPMAKLEAGAQAPTFTLPDQDDNPVSLEDFKGQRVILYFYPADDTPGCIREACQFNDNLVHFQAAGVPVIGISRDDAQSHQRFRNKYGLQFPLLTDDDHQVMDAYRAWGEKTRYGQTSIGVLRSTFLVDEQGRIERAWHNVKADGHATQVLDALSSKI